ncbi:enoyl-CoA hydratase-related protein [Alkalibacillus sp. S2W]|uniref:enoyl-CoA hydratase-related protein n=1 Tax=Alkalibacillus sp. S2W TaxID=3386553 RepID=UPI00398CDD48
MRTVTWEMQTNYVGILYLNRPDAANAFSTQLIEDFHHALDEIEAHEDLRALIITGKGEKAFCAGADLKERQTMTEDEVVKTVRSIGGLVRRVEQLSVPTIAAINGAAFGGGLELSLACDIRVASDKAKMGLTETSLAIIPGAGGTQRLAKLIGLAKAKYYILTAKRFGSEEAQSIGLIEENVSHDKLVDQAVTLANQISANGPVGVRAAKQAIERGYERDIATGLEIERHYYLTTIPTEDRLEALQAFKDKRQPQFKGK